MEDIVNGYSYFENYPEFYWEPVKLFQGGGNMGPTTKAMSRAAALWTR